MRKAGMVLGIAGGAMAIMVSIVLIAVMAVSGAALNSGAVEKAINAAMQNINPNEHNFFDDYPSLDQGDLAEIVHTGIGAGFVAVMAFAVIGLIGGALALAGGIINGKNPVLSGVFLIVGAVFTACYCVTFILMGIAAVFLFIKRQSPVLPAPANR